MYRSDTASLNGIFCLLSFVFAFRLFEDVAHGFLIVPPKERGCDFPAQIAVHAYGIHPDWTTNSILIPLPKIP